MSPTLKTLKRKEENGCYYLTLRNQKWKDRGERMKKVEEKSDKKMWSMMKRMATEEKGKQKWNEEKQD